MQLSMKIALVALYGDIPADARFRLLAMGSVRDNASYIELLAQTFNGKARMIESPIALERAM